MLAPAWSLTLVSRSRERLEIPFDVNLWEAAADSPGPKSVLAPVDPADYGIDPLGYL